MDRNSMEQRTTRFAVDIIRLVSGLPRNWISAVASRQLLRSGTSIGANYREANRAESRNDFVHKIALAEKETAETLYWLEILREAGLNRSPQLPDLQKEADELLALFCSIGRTAKQRRRK